MTRADDLVRLRHMLDAAQKAVSHAKRRQRGDLDSDELFALAMTHLIEIVGEAARSVSHEVSLERPYNRPVLPDDPGVLDRPPDPFR